VSKYTHFYAVFCPIFKGYKVRKCTGLETKRILFHSSKYISDKNKAFEDASPECNNFYPENMCEYCLPVINVI